MIIITAAAAIGVTTVISNIIVMAVVVVAVIIVTVFSKTLTWILQIAWMKMGTADDAGGSRVSLFVKLVGRILMMKMMKVLIVDNTDTVCNHIIFAIKAGDSRI
jgi:hypothetical protein